MKTTSTRAALAVCMCLSAWVAASAGTWYVDADNYGKTGLTGKSEALAYGTIQEAIDRAASGDTIYVAPGVYSNGLGSCVASWGKSRIGWNSKKLFIYSTGDASNTHIVGMKDPSSATGTGANAVRCLSIYDNSGTSCSGTVFKGFTFRDGSTVSDKSQGTGLQDSALQGGAVRVSHRNIYFLDCVFTGCSAVTGGAVCNGTYLRCKFTRNMCEALASKTVIYGTDSTNKVRLYACVVHHNQWGANRASGGIMIYYAEAINCTIVDNAFSSCCYSANERFYNTVFFGSGALNASCFYTNCVTSGRSVMSTIHPDVRLIAGSAACTAGDGAHLARIQLPEGVEYSDYGGNTPATSGTIAAGATQTALAPAAGGIATIGYNTCVDGTGQCRNDAYSYVFPDAYPTQYLFTAEAVPAGKRLAYFQFKANASSDYDYRFPDRNDRLWVMPPADPNVVISNHNTAVQSITYVDPAADAELADGTEEHPYRTLQKACDTKTGTVIVAKPGIYEEGFEEHSKFGRSRLLTTHVTRITSEAGAERTIIRGAADTTADADEYGRGPNAVRCVLHTANMTQIQGFTLTGGRTAKSGDAGKGGAAYSGSMYLDLDDCIITNNCANEDSALHVGRMQRCYVADNRSRNFVASAGRYRASVFENNHVDLATDGLFGNSSTIVNCTVLASSGQSLYYTGSTINRYATVFCGGSLARANGASAGNVYGNVETVQDTAGLVADPLLADPENGDWHPFASSPVFAAGVVPTVDNYGRTFWYSATSDYEGNPLSFDGGKPVAGAFMKPTSRRMVALLAKNGGLSPASSRVEVPADGTVTLGVGAGTRPIAGVVVGGVTNAIQDSGWSLSVNGADIAGGLAVAAFYTNVWYAAVDGDDGATGFFADAAKTLQGALTNSNLVAGDRVVALPGVYRTGKTIQPGDYEIYSRAVVPANVTLESRDGRETTIIEGARATVADDPPSTSTDVRGLGVDAVRCVLLQAGATVKGFTLTNGWTRSMLGGKTLSHGSPDTCGGGVYCAAVNSCTVEDCLLVGNGAYRGGGVFSGTSANCEFASNYAYYGGGATSDGRNRGCFSHDNVSATWSVICGIFYIRDAVNCTCFDSLSQGYGGTGFIGMTNTVVTGYFYPPDIASNKVSHCAFNNSKLYSVSAGYMPATDECLSTNMESLVFGADGRPEIGRNLCVDAGTASVLPMLGQTDVHGGQRVYNGSIDIGAAEADWRGRYGRDIHMRMGVQAASPEVQELPDGSVLVPEGASVSGTMRGSARAGGMMRFSFRVSDGGMALLVVDGVETSYEGGLHEVEMPIGETGVEISVTAVSGSVGGLRAKSLDGSAIFIL